MRTELSRREALILTATAVLPGSPKSALAQPSSLLVKPIPSSGEAIPVVGLGSWITFNVGGDTELRDECTAVMQAFFEAGGRLIDSSPMYGSAQDTIGYGLQKLSRPPSLFAADKVWISDAKSARKQIEQSRSLWGVPQFNLLQVHNLLSWQEHLETLFELKASGQLKYVGITTSEGRRHADIEAIMKSQPIDFVQISYNVLDREAEERILPLAVERNIAVIVNRSGRAILSQTWNASLFPNGFRRQEPKTGRSCCSSSSSPIPQSPALSLPLPVWDTFAKTWKRRQVC